MSVREGMFSLDNIIRIIEERCISNVVLVDTNIWVKHPHFERWETKINNPLYVLPHFVPLELAEIHNKYEPKSKNARDIREAKRAISRLHDSGVLKTGYFVHNVGWFARVSPPELVSANLTMQEWEPVKNVLGYNDTMLLVLAQELRKSVNGTPVVVATNDRSLSDSANSLDIPSFLFTDKRWHGIEELLSKYCPVARIDWDALLKEICERAAICIELRLTSLKHMPEGDRGTSELPEYLGTIIAEGYGHFELPGKGNVSFQWYVESPKWEMVITDDIEKSLELSGQGVWSKTSVTIEYLPPIKDVDVPEWIKDRLRETLWGCCDPLAYISGVKTIQEPFAIMQQYLMMSYLYDPVFDSTEDIISRLETPEEIRELFLYWIFSRQAEETMEETADVIRDFITALNSFWFAGTSVQVKFNRPVY